MIGGNGEDPPDSEMEKTHLIRCPALTTESQRYWEARRQLTESQRYWEARRQLRKARDTGKQEDSYSGKPEILGSKKTATGKPKILGSKKTANALLLINCYKCTHPSLGEAEVKVKLRMIPLQCTPHPWGS
ncbi:unnamed protein product [Rodentolepis nana]|uniref:NUFIP1 domain-containing protein n=1 Tax=Rodentolepis nana TaxID=102285 RepID=A0A0R3TXN3_RODNA|nr:unnamed protein product [Rodentolepis nana]